MNQEEPASGAAQNRPFLKLFTAPAVITAAIFAVSMFAILQYSVRAHIPGSLDVGGFTLANFAGMLRPLYAWVFIDTVWLCLLTAVLSLIFGYPLAYALVRSTSLSVKSFILITTVTPLVPRRGGADLFLDRGARQ